MPDPTLISPSILIVELSAVSEPDKNRRKGNDEEEGEEGEEEGGEGEEEGEEGEEEGEEGEDFVLDPKSAIFKVPQKSNQDEFRHAVCGIRFLNPRSAE